MTALGPASPTPAIAIAGGAASASSRFAASPPLSDDLVAALSEICEVVTSDELTAEFGRDWWPLAMIWATEAQVPARAAAVVSPTSTEQVSSVLALCNAHGIAVTAAGGRSGVCGGVVPVHGGVTLDTNALAGIVDVDDTSLLVRVGAGTYGDHLEAELGSDYGLTIGHWPQSMSLATVGGWVACRGAGQFSTRYGKIEDLVAGLEVVLASGEVVRTGGQPRQAAGPDLTQTFVGSEGTLGIITEVTLKASVRPTHTVQGAWAFSTFSEGLDACRRILRRGARPAVLRLYDEIESDRGYKTGEGRNVLLVFDEADPLIADATLAVVVEECASVERLSDDLVDSWMGHRNDVSALESLIGGGLVVDTMEVAGPWSRLDAIYRDTIAAMSPIGKTYAVSAHQSHAYSDGACLYFTFGGKPTGGDTPEQYYTAMWEAGTRAVLANGGALSHHHGVGLNRSRFVADALGSGFGVYQSMKDALDPSGILNPGKMGLRSPFGEPVWP